MYLCVFQGIKAPSSIERSSITANSGAKCWCIPRPEQSGQAPKGLLKEKSRGSISGRLIWQSGQIYFSVNSRSGISLDRSITNPSESFSDISTASVRRVRCSSRTLRRSMTASMVWRLFLSRAISSSSQ